ncbi:hypothetical protein TNCT_339471, partial [Trichonephila clavata]
MHQNAINDPQFCSETFHSPVNVVPCRNEHYATPPFILVGRVT